MFKSVVKLAPKLNRPRVNGLHTLPNLDFDKSKGIPGLYSAKGLDIAWYQYQQYLLDNLNEELKQREVYTGSDFKTPISVLVAALEDSKHDTVAAKIAHWASLAYSNEFFFQSLLPANRNPDAVIGPSEEPLVVNKSVPGLGPVSYIFDADQGSSFYQFINTGFEDSVAFRELILSRGSAMFGNGFLWLINLKFQGKILNCYNSGSPFSGNLELAENKPSEMVDEGRFSPLLAINLWQHAYLEDYGIEGKRDFIRNVFDTINWERVINRFETARVSGKSFY